MFKQHLNGIRIIALSLSGMMVACDAKKPDPMAKSPAPSPPSAVDWANVKAPTSLEARMSALTHVARLADVWNQGRPGTFRLRFASPGRVVDDRGNGVAFTPEKWKAAQLMITAAKGGRAATRAIPKTNYADGLARAKRCAYEAVLDGDDIVLTFLKVLDDESDG